MTTYYKKKSLVLLALVMTVIMVLGVILITPITANAAGDITVIGGNGGNGGNGYGGSTSLGARGDNGSDTNPDGTDGGPSIDESRAFGGRGGDGFSLANNISDAVTGNITLTGGNGGRSGGYGGNGAGGRGGDGGSVNYTVASTTIGTINLTSGDEGVSSGSGSVGLGGNVNLTLTADHVVTGPINLITGNGTRGGNAKLTVNYTISTPSITANPNPYRAPEVDINTLIVDNQDTTLSPTNNNADYFTINTAIIKDGRTLTINNSSSRLTIGEIIIHGSGELDVANVSNLVNNNTIHVYDLTVENGTDNTGKNPYEENTQISLKANKAPDGKIFDGWTSSGGGTFDDETSESTTFTMPASNVTVTANYIDDPNPQPKVLQHFKTFDGTGSRSATIDADLQDYIKLTLNGEDVDASNIDVTSGSTIITLHEKYLKTFSDGSYTFVAHFTNGRTVNLPITIAANSTIAANNSGNPNTGDEAPIGLLLTTLFALAATALIINRKIAKD